MRKRLKLAGLVILLILVAWLLTALLTTSSRRSQGRHTADSFVSQVLAGNYTASYKQFSLSAKQQQSLSDWTSTVIELKVYFKGSNATYKDTALDTRTTTVTYTIVAHNSTYLFNVGLAKDGKQWQVESFTSKRQV